MSSEINYQPITIMKKSYYTDEGKEVSSISIFLGDDEIVFGALTLEEAIERFDYYFGGQNTWE